MAAAARDCGRERVTSSTSSTSSSRTRFCSVSGGAVLRRDRLSHCFTWNLDIFSTSPLLRFLEEFLEEFYVKVDTDPEVDSPWSAMGACECDKVVILRWRQVVFLAEGAHHTGDELMSSSLSDCRCIDRCGVAVHTHQVVSETTTTTTTLNRNRDAHAVEYTYANPLHERI